jgi:hypothetical protein
MKKLGWLVLVSAVAFACGEAGQSMSSGAGAMDGGGGTTDGTGATPGTGATGGTPEQNVRVECDKSAPIPSGGTRYAAEFEVDPGRTEVTVCGDGTPSSFGNISFGRDSCNRRIAGYYEGTTTGFVDCGTEPGRYRVTVHR